MHHVTLNWAWSYDRHFDDQIVKGARLKPWKHRHLRTAFDLKRPDGIALRYHVVRRFVFGADGRDLERQALVPIQEVKCMVDAGERSETQEINLARAAEFPPVYNSDQDKSASPPSTEESPARVKLPPGFTATVFSAEPGRP